jgi:hypothetical protein
MQEQADPQTDQQAWNAAKACSTWVAARAVRPVSKRRQKLRWQSSSGQLGWLRLTSWWRLQSQRPAVPVGCGATLHLSLRLRRACYAGDRFGDRMTRRMGPSQDSSIVIPILLWELLFATWLVVKGCAASAASDRRVAHGVRFAVAAWL